MFSFYATTKKLADSTLGDAILQLPTTKVSQTKAILNNCKKNWIKNNLSINILNEQIRTKTPSKSICQFVKNLSQYKMEVL